MALAAPVAAQQFVLMQTLLEKTYGVTAKINAAAALGSEEQWWESSAYEKNAVWSASHDLVPKSATLGWGTVRRPLRGIDIKPDSYAVLEVAVSDSSTVLPLSEDKRHPKLAHPDAPDKTLRISNFLIQNYTMGSAEKSQIVETFGDDYVYFFGRHPRQLTIQGLLLNTKDFRWRDEFWYNYENSLRGTKLAERRAKIQLFVDGQMITGYGMSADASASSNEPYLATFTLTMLVDTYERTDVPVRDVSSENYKTELAYQVKFDANVYRARKALLSQPPGSSSLFAQVGAALDAVKNMAGKINFLDKWYRYAYGRQILLPSGWWEGSAAIDTGNGVFAAGSIDNTLLATGGIVATKVKLATAMGVNAVPPGVGNPIPAEYSLDEYIGTGSSTFDRLAAYSVGGKLSPILAGIDTRNEPDQLMKGVGTALSTQQAMSFGLDPQTAGDAAAFNSTTGGQLAQIAARLSYGAAMVGASFGLQTAPDLRNSLVRKMMADVDLAGRKRTVEYGGTGKDGAWGKANYIANISGDGVSYKEYRTPGGFANPRSWSGGYVPKAFAGRKASDPEFITQNDQGRLGYYSVINGRTAFIDADPLLRRHIKYLSRSESSGWKTRVESMREYYERVRGAGYEGLGARGDWGSPTGQYRRYITIMEKQQSQDVDFGYTEYSSGAAPSGTPFAGTKAPSTDDLYVPAHQRGLTYQGRKPTDFPNQYETVTDAEGYVGPGKKLFTTVVSVEDSEAGGFRYTDIPGGSFGNRSFVGGYMVQAYRAESFVGVGSFGRWGSRKYTRGYIPVRDRGSVLTDSGQASNEANVDASYSEF